MRAIPTKHALAAVALGAAAVVGINACGGNGATKAAAAAGTQTPSDSAPAPSIRVAGHGEVEGTPDTMTISLGVTTNDTSAQAALDRNNEEATRLIDTLTGHGVAKKDIQTTNLGITPNFDKSFHVTGYRANNTVTATLHGLGNAGAVIDAAAAAVGNDIRLDGVDLSLQNSKELLAKARTEAVKDALEQGQQLAAAGGVKLGAIRTIDDTGSTGIERAYTSFNQARSAVLAPIEPGSAQLSFDVEVVFDIAT